MLLSWQIFIAQLIVPLIIQMRSVLHPKSRKNIIKSWIDRKKHLKKNTDFLIHYESQFPWNVMYKKLFTPQQYMYLCFISVSQPPNFILSTPIFNTNRHKWHKSFPYSDIIHCKLHCKFLVDTHTIITNKNNKNRKCQE